jgi:class 3 adenylate cyclase/tetratricopeptide (TPR) repeat protein
MSSEIEKLERTMIALEAQRAILGDAVVETTLASLREKLNALRSSTESLAAGSDDTQQRKIITVLFADIVGLADWSDVEELRDAMSSLWGQLDSIIIQRGGRIDKHMGNGVMALWGAEQVSEDDPEQAIGAALALRAALNAFCEQSPLLTSEEAKEIKLRVGINTGPAIVGLVGMTGEFTALGDTVNLAARLNQAARPGDILAGHDTYRLVRGVFDVEAQPPMLVKGKSEPVLTYIVLQVKPRAFRLQSQGVEGIETPLIARDLEISEFHAAFIGMFERHEARVISIMGDLGLGKSRLLYEFVKWADARSEDWWLFQGRCSPSQGTSPYSFLRELFAFRFEIHDNDALSVVHEKMERGFAEFMSDDPRADEKAHIIGQLIGYDFSESPYLRGLLQDPRQLRSLSFSYLVRFFVAAAQKLPIVMLLDDLHWADSGSLDALIYVFQNLPAGTPLMALCTARPALMERSPDWGNGLPGFLQLELKPLSRDDCRALVEGILQKAESLPAALRELVVGGADGNPFYVEELIKMLIDGKVIQPGEEIWKIDITRLDTVSIPPTLAGVLQARLDRLDSLERTALQRASIVGRVFWNTAIEVLSPDLQTEPERLQASLAVLQAKELIFPSPVSTFSGTQEYSFKHALLRDVTYETVLKRQRAQYHARVAEWLSAASGERRGEYLPVIADHFERGGDLTRAVSSLTEAGEQALGVSAFNDAFRFFQRALSLLPPETMRDECHLNLKLGETLFRSGDLSNALRYSEVALAKARALTGGDFLASILCQIGQINAEIGNYALAERIFSEALPIARGNGRPSRGTLARALYGLGNVHWRLGNLEKARNFCEESRTLAEATGDTNTLLLALNRLGVLSGLMGDPAGEEQRYQQVLTLATTFGNRERAGVALNNLGALADEQGDLRKAQDFYLQAMALAREIGAQQSLSLYLTNLAHSEIRLGDLDQARFHLREGLSLAYRLNVGPWALTAVLFFARLEAARGNFDFALELFGLADHHPAFSLDHQRLMEQMLTEWGLSEGDVIRGMARGALLAWDETVRSLMVG